MRTKETIFVTLIVCALFYFLIMQSFCFAKDISSPFNNLKVKDCKSGSSYSFFIGGHLYGAPENRGSVFPASSILAAIDLINAQDPAFFISLGDNYFSPQPLYVSNFIDSFAINLSCPFFTAVGNHDQLSFRENFGSTYFDFSCASALFIFLDTELGKGVIQGIQLEYFKKTIREFMKNPKLNLLFICSHKPIWAPYNPPYAIVYEHVNNAADYPPDNHTFKNTIEPLLIEASSKYMKNIYWLSGDIGCSWTLPVFFSKDLQHNIAYVATGIGDVLHDAIIRIDVDKNAGVKFTPISLTGQELESIECYDAKYWQSFFEPKESKPSEFLILKAKITRLIRHKYFWAGVLLSSLSLLFFSLLKYLFKKRL